MKVYTGFIQEITEIDPYKTGHVKKIITLKEDDDQVSFIEFLGESMLKTLDQFALYDRVSITAFHKGSQSRKGLRFNNIIAKSIKTPQLCNQN
jgi:hypothetical protein